MKNEGQKALGADAAADVNDTTVASEQRQETRVIGACPRDGRDWENQCARCGSSLFWNECDNCGGEGWIDDDDWQADEGDGHNCDWCSAQGGHWSCISSAEYCEGNPIRDRAEVKRGTVEWFTFDPPLATTQGATSGIASPAASSAQESSSSTPEGSQRPEERR